jgi:hypothetical protein
MTFIFTVLALGERDHGGGQLIAAQLSELGTPATTGDAVFDLSEPLDRSRWTGIVVHHLGAPTGDAESIHRQHLEWGYDGLGYHFVIGNGNGLGDGIIQVGYRWDEQLPGAHVLGEAGREHNLHSIGICLIGNGDRRPFTEAQLRSLGALVRQLQGELDISRSNVLLHRELAPETTSPGRFFAAGTFYAGLND